MIWILPAIFVLIHDPSGDRAVQWTGQTQSDVSAMLTAQGYTYDFMTETEYNGWLSSHTTPPPTPAQITANLRATATSIISDKASAPSVSLRAILLTIFDENNNTRQWIQSFKAAVAASTSLADLKTRVAALPDMPDRTIAQAKTAVQNKISSGGAD